MDPYYTQSIECLSQSLSINIESGHSENTAQGLLKKAGENILKGKAKSSALLLFISQFRSFIIYILFFAIVLSLLQNEYVDAIVIFTILIANAIIGFIQEYRAEKEIDALKQLSGLNTTVLRDGEIRSIPARRLVPGDIIYLEEGNKIPADARLIQTKLFQVSEAALTGESAPIYKDTETLVGILNLAEQSNMAFSGTLVVKGKASAIVTTTGMNTELGKIASVLNEVEFQTTPLQKKLDVLGKRIGIFTLIICFAVLITGLISDQLLPLLLNGNWSEFLSGASSWLLLAVVLAVAAVPEGLPAIVTISLSIGVRNMARRNVVIRRLPSVETLGETTVICSDKTGTLTKNEMTVRKLFVDEKIIDVPTQSLSFEGHLKPDGLDTDLSRGVALLLRAGALCNDANIDSSGAITGDPTEAALLVSASKFNMIYSDERKTAPRLDELPFDSIRKMMSTLHSLNEGYIQFTKGAPEQVLSACEHILIDGQKTPLTPQLRSKILDRNTELAKQALRVLGFAYLERNDGILNESSLVFLGLQGMIDPPHSEVPLAISDAINAGIRIIMITGDNRYTAEAVASEIGIIGESIEGHEFKLLPYKEQIATLSTTSIFYRVEPSHKLLIVELLQEQGEIVAMTGDGVNDAPAIKKADIGIAMGISGTDVAKEASDMILLDDNFANIVHAIEEGRGIFANIRKFVNYLLSSNLGEVFVVFFALILFGVDQLPMTAVMLLWLNLVTDGLPALALSVDPRPDSLMKNTPGISSKYILNRYIAFNIAVVSVLITVGVLFVFYWAGLNGESLAYRQTMAFTTIILLELVRLQTIRQEYQLGMFSNIYLVAAVCISIGLQLIVIYTPLSSFFGTVAISFVDWTLLILVAFSVWICNRFVQFFMSKNQWLRETPTTNPG
ncbi:MAG: cation-translocating P-type ATPase [Gammaproteobacteria bacterium]|nr:cation-translocating P-type ATPase [Gammaproteobacteria bacterium]